jgi:hypothetical protein
VLTLASICSTLGFLLALYLEATGGILPSAGRRTSTIYLAALAGGALLSVLLPALICRRIMRSERRTAAPAE